MINFLDLNAQYLSIKDEIDSAIASVIRDSAFIGGKYANEFEENFSEYQNAKYCIGVGNGTDALEIAIEALNLPKNSEIIVPANSFIASAEAIIRSGHRVVFCDVNSDDYTISASDIKNRINSATSAIIAVHLYGHPCDMDALLSIAKEHNLKIIEDCAQAHGAEYRNKKIGAIGDVGCFSFYPGKNLGAYGDAGAIVTNNNELSVKCRMIANHGRISKYDHKFSGRNSRLDGLQAAILNVKLKYIDQWTSQRIMIAEEYLTQLANCSDVVLPVKQKWVKQVYHLFVIRTENRNNLMRVLSEAGVQTGIHYPIALPKLEAFKYLGQSEEDGFAWNSDESLLSLPVNAALGLDAVRKVSNIIITQ